MYLQKSVSSGSADGSWNSFNKEWQLSCISAKPLSFDWAGEQIGPSRSLHMSKCSLIFLLWTREQCSGWRAGGWLYKLCLKAPATVPYFPDRLRASKAISFVLMVVKQFYNHPNARNVTFFFQSWQQYKTVKNKTLGFFLWDLQKKLQ